MFTDNLNTGSLRCLPFRLFAKANWIVPLGYYYPSPFNNFLGNFFEFRHFLSVFLPTVAPVVSVMLSDSEILRNSKI